MIRFAGTVHYKDGTQVEYEIGTRGMLAWEAYARRNNIVGDPRQTSSAWTMLYVIAHYAVTGEESGFDVWKETVADLDVDSDAGEAVPPTLPVALVE
jgi:hypothetical protein